MHRSMVGLAVSSPADDDDAEMPLIPTGHPTLPPGVTTAEYAAALRELEAAGEPIDAHALAVLIGEVIARRRAAQEVARGA